ncbi:HAD family hydrolase [Amnibacterium setariae]|uniref:HAD family hydrolase n=1 Tax=Amnibacterium setariae TaxID=2306585 RepID=A0A3A1TZI1_9MICO|nr:HAD family hydrolase [Amnibacterium setariae]RIX26430.1 HAD family hydrolase [Amnibacterium setariae]
MPALVLFDLDGTLVDGAGLPSAMRATCEAIAAEVPGVSPDELVAANTAVWQRRWPEVEDDYMLGGRAGEEIGREAWRETLAECGLEDPALLERAWSEWRRQERASLRLFPDVLPALDRLAAEGIRVGMVTNGSGAVQRGKLDAVGLTGRFDPLTVSSEAGVKKPDPAVFAVALAAAGIGPEDVWFVGDNLWHDMPGALETGIRGVWLDRAGVALPPDGPRPDAVIRSLDELLPER